METKPVLISSEAYLKNNNVVMDVPNNNYIINNVPIVENYNINDVYMTLYLPPFFDCSCDCDSACNCECSDLVILKSASCCKKFCTVMLAIAAWWLFIMLFGFIAFGILILIVFTCNCDCSSCTICCCCTTNDVVVNRKKVIFR